MGRLHPGHRLARSTYIDTAPLFKVDGNRILPWLNPWSVEI